MIIKFYEFLGDERELNKQLNEKADSVGFFRKDFNFRNGVLYVNLSMMEPVTALSFNYCSFEFEGRTYYFYIRQNNMYRKNSLQLIVNIDVLMTYQKEILEIWGIVERTNLDSFVEQDGVFNSIHEFEKIEFTQQLGLNTYVIVTQGGN